MNQIDLPSIQIFLQQMDSNYFVPRTTCRCLFGAPDPNELADLLAAQDLVDRDRLLTRWGYDSVTEQFVALSPLPSRPRKTPISSVRRRKAKKLECNENIENSYSSEVFNKNNSVLNEPRKVLSDIKNVGKCGGKATSSARKKLFSNMLDDKKIIGRDENKPYNKQTQITGKPYSNSII